MKKYTEKIHAGRLLKMLAMDEPCLRCPGRKRFVKGDATSGCLHKDTYADKYLDAKNMTKTICPVCRQFVWLNLGEGLCPCNVYGDKEAIKKTWKALREKGYV